MNARSHKPKLSRREMLTGRVWRMLATPQRCAVTESPPAPVLRYPKRAQDIEGEPEANEERESRSGAEIQGISIEPVALKESPASSAQRQPLIPLFRPPGAIEESAFLAGCTRCEACIEACPHGAIFQSSGRSSAQRGTPILNADIAACQMCEDYPCIAACEPGVLTHAVPKMMGTARITAHLCLAHHGDPCSACSDHCPVENAIHNSDGKPIVREDVCTGCGVCRQACPAPENAILLMPTFVRPTPAGNASDERV